MQSKGSVEVCSGLATADGSGAGVVMTYEVSTFSMRILDYAAGGLQMLYMLQPPPLVRL